MEIAGVPGFGLVYVPYRDLSEPERLHEVDLLRFAPLNTASLGFCQLMIWVTRGIFVLIFIPWNK